jgi:hypothetical protein
MEQKSEKHTRSKFQLRQANYSYIFVLKEALCVYIDQNKIKEIIDTT